MFHHFLHHFTYSIGGYDNFHFIVLWWIKSIHLFLKGNITVNRETCVLKIKLNESVIDQNETLYQQYTNIHSPEYRPRSTFR